MMLVLIGIKCNTLAAMCVFVWWERENTPRTRRQGICTSELDSIPRPHDYWSNYLKKNILIDLILLTMPPPPTNVCIFC